MCSCRDSKAVAVMELALSVMVIAVNVVMENMMVTKAVVNELGNKTENRNG